MSDNETPSGGTNTQQLFVRSIQYETTDEEFQTWFQQFGDMIECKLVKDRETGQCKGFGFVTFCTEEAQKAALDFPDHELNGRSMRVQISEKGGSGGGYNKHESNKIFVGKLPQEASDQEVQEYFSSFGVVTEVKIPKDHETQQGRGFAFVTFEDPSVASSVLEGGPHEIAGQQVHVKKAVKKEAQFKPFGGMGGYGMMGMMNPMMMGYGMNPYMMGGYGGMGWGGGHGGAGGYGGMAQMGGMPVPGSPGGAPGANGADAAGADAGAGGVEGARYAPY